MAGIDAPMVNRALRRVAEEYGAEIKLYIITSVEVDQSAISGVQPNDTLHVLEYLGYNPMGSAYVASYAGALYDYEVSTKTLGKKLYVPRGVMLEMKLYQPMNRTMNCRCTLAPVTRKFLDQWKKRVTEPVPV